MRHEGFFTVNGDELEGSSFSLAQSSEPCSRVRCECGWETEIESGVYSLRAAKAALARHQHEALESQ